MAKFKIKYVKFVFTPRQNRGEDWPTCPEVKIAFGSKHTDEFNSYQFHRNNISTIFSDYLEDDNRRWNKRAKFTESEASILLLKYLEDKLKDARKNKKYLESTIKHKVNTQSHMWDYSIQVNKREITFNEQACKIWRKKVREIKKSKEYMWEQLAK